MAGRVIAQILVMGTQIVGKAFMEAYRQAAANAAKNGGHQAAKQGGTKTTAAADAATRKTGLSIDEAMNILNVTREADLAKIVKNYEHLFKVNDKEAGGSFYLQSKVVRAKERLEMEWAAQAKAAGKEAESASASAADSTAAGSSSSSHSSPSTPPPRT